MAAEVIYDFALASGNSASTTFTFVPSTPNGASIAAVSADVLVGGTLGTLSSTFTNVVDGNEVSTTETNLTGSLTTATKSTVSSIAWTSVPPLVTLVLGSAPTTGTNNIYIAYTVTFD